MRTGLDLHKKPFCHKMIKNPLQAQERLFGFPVELSGTEVWINCIPWVLIRDPLVLNLLRLNRRESFNEFPALIKQ